MTRLADLAERSTFTADFKGQASIGQLWIKTQIKSKPNARPASLQQIERKVTLCSPVKTRESIHAVLNRRYPATKAQ